MLLHSYLSKRTARKKKEKKNERTFELAACSFSRHPAAAFLAAEEFERLERAVAAVSPSLPFFSSLFTRT